VNGIGRTAGRPGTNRPNSDTAVFAELVCADSELLRAEFDAIVAANFPAELGLPAPRGPHRPVGVGAALAPRRHSSAGDERAHGSPGGDRPPPAARERSPPGVR
jgi:hypothetical protein